VGCRPVAATHFEPRFAGFRANVHGRSNGALGAKTRRERRWRSARRSAGRVGANCGAAQFGRLDRRGARRRDWDRRDADARV